ncbi:ABC transporter substrate-binding protein [Sediminibacillus massiliensis]|uniref:ABC transporter substrate-binding protein n=1 Tax=Sediminibacillus massiliensis TaxID=1926277 RepID=UPI0009883D72|nr:sugar ABC transporter substrate-binding protein [Sediminibacillus massiliensis]
MKNNKFLLALMFGLIAILLMACSGEGSETSGDAEETQTMGDDVEDATELTFWTFTELHNDFYANAVDRWNEENPDKAIKLKAETYPYDQMHNNLLLALQSGEGAPDIVDVEISRFPNYLAGEPQLLPMNEYVEPVIDDFVKARFEIYSKDGQYYGMPTHVGATMMYYNTEIMEEAGVDIDSIETWDDYVEAGKKVVENTDAMMTTVPTGDYLPYWSLVSQRGSDFTNAEGELTINNQANIDTLQFQHDLVSKHEIAELTPGGEPHAEEFYSYMNEGGAASLVMPMWYMGRFLDYMPDLSGKMAIRPLPAWEEGGNRSAGMGGTGTVVTNQTEHPDLAREFLAYAKLSEEGNIDLWKVLGFDPPMWTVWEDPALQEDNEYFDYFSDEIFETLLSVREEINELHITEKTPAIAQEINTNVLDSVLRQESQTPEEALNAAQEAVENQ